MLCIAACEAAAGVAQISPSCGRRLCQVPGGSSQHYTAVAILIRLVRHIDGHGEFPDIQR